MTDKRTSEADLSARRKRACFRAWHRGIREMDLIAGPFADANVPAMSGQELDMFEVLLEVPDRDILDFVMDRGPLPEGCDTNFANRLKSFAAANGAVRHG